jgi:GINS complex subunit 1
MNYGQHGRNLLLELKRSEPSNTGDYSTSSTIPAYNDVLVTNALQDVRLHCQALEEQVQASDGKPSLNVRPSLLLQNAAIQRNKRCLLTYHTVRLQRIQEELYWKQQQHHHNNNSNTTEQQQQQQQPSNLCPVEHEFLANYANLIQRYTQDVCQGCVMDLRSHVSMPPQPSDRVQIRVLTDIGPIVLESGASAVLSTNSTHFLQYADVEELIRQGKVQVLNGEEDE